MKIPNSFLLLLLIGGNASSAQAADPPVHSRHAHSDKSHPRVGHGTQIKPLNKPSDSIAIKPNRSAETASAKEHSFNSFSDMSQSIPSEATKNELARKHQLPGQQTSVLTPGDPAGTAVNSPTLNNATTGAQPRIQTGSGMSVPQPSGGTSGVFK